MDKVELLNKRLKEVVDKFESLKKSGIDEEILEIFLQHKTGLSKKKIKEVLKNVDDFYNKLLKNLVLNGLKDDN